MNPAFIPMMFALMQRDPERRRQIMTMALPLAIPMSGSARAAMTVLVANNASARTQRETEVAVRQAATAITRAIALGGARIPLQEVQALPQLNAGLERFNLRANIVP